LKGANAKHAEQASGKAMRDGRLTGENPPPPDPASLAGMQNSYKKVKQILAPRRKTFAQTGKRLRRKEAK
jgi:hypothetical protein